MDKIKNNILMETYTENIGYKFKNLENFRTAITHTSYANENSLNHNSSNQRLEFLGDSVLDLVISELIYNRYSHYPEGELTKIRANVVCEHTLSIMANKIDLGKILFLGKGEELNGGRERQSILADAFEALIGAIFIDGGFARAKKFLLNKFKNEINDLMTEKSITDYKTFLQEMIQKEHRGKLVYNLVEEKGPDHEKKFKINACINGITLGSGIGKSKKQAEQTAAKFALKNLKYNLNR